MSLNLTFILCITLCFGEKVAGKVQVESTDGHHDISSSCVEDIRHLIDWRASDYTSNSLAAHKWQHEMWDSYGKLPAGLLEGNVFWMGDFEQCTSLKVWRSTQNRQKVDNVKPDFRGKYCLPNFNHYFPKLKMEHAGRLPNIATFGICIPSSCNTSEVETMLNKNISPLKAEIVQEQCHTEESTEYDGGTFIALIPFIILGTLMMLGTAYEIATKIKLTFERKSDQKEQQTGIIKILKAFSAYSNTRRILNTSAKRAELSCINGVRAMSMVMVVIGHITLFMYVMTNGKHNPAEMAKIRSSLWTQPFTHAPYSVETFFFLTGFLVTLQIMERAIKTKKFNIPLFYIHRFKRLTPSLLLLSALVAGPFQLMGKGPLWTSSPFYVHSVCQKSWWKTILFVSIYFKDTTSMTTCMPHTWYLSAEMFFYVLSPVILYPLIKKRWFGFAIWSALFAASYVITAFAEYEVVKDATNSYTSFVVRRSQHKMVSTKPWCRMQTFLLGMLFGYVYHCHKRRPFTLSKKTKTLMWLAVTTTMTSCIFANYALQNGIRGYPAKLEYIVDFTISPSAWVFCVGSIILACATGNGGVVNNILSWKFLVPIARISFSVYLIHFEVAAHFSLSRKQALYTDYHLLYFSWIGITIVSLFFSWIFTLLVELPSAQL